jgi:hypothetical protein
MLSNEDSVWLAREYPELTNASEEISGVLQFTAAYDERSGRFFVVNDELVNEKLGTDLSGTFEVRIKGRLDKNAQELPTLHVDGPTHTPEQHFNQTDFSACLCSPLEEQDFLTPEFEFRKFFNQLVVPFLYGQVFPSVYGSWPWTEYAHGATGLLEAYARNKDRRRTQQCINRLAEDSDWPRIKTVLLQEVQVQCETRCFCRSQRSIKRCHPQALHGARLLQQDLRYWPVPCHRL